MDKKSLSKIICFLIILTIIAPSYLSKSESKSSINYSFIDENHENQEKMFSDLKYYGFVVSPPLKNKLLENPQKQYETLNLVNDLTRNKINVYYNLEPLNLEVIDSFYDSKSHTNLYEKGSILIPFSGNQFRDITSTIIVLTYSSYNHNNSNPVHFQYITEPIPDIELMNLESSRISYYFDEGITIECLNWYLSSMIKAGFLNCEILADEDIINNLTINRYNTLIVPGGRLIEGFKKDLNLFQKIERQNKIKNFISNGGGYVGSCYGAFISSSGMRYTPFLVYQYYTKKLPSLGFLSLSDALLGLGFPSNINVSIKDSDNPVLFGLNGTIPGSVLRGGPVYTWVGKNSEELASIESIDTSWFHFIDSIENRFIKKLFYNWINFTLGKTIWISSRYGEGKIVTFGDHPEKGNILLKKAVHNSVLFVSSETLKAGGLNNFYSYHWMKSILDGFNAFSIEPQEIGELHKLSERINAINRELDEISVLYDSISEEFNNLSASHLIDWNLYYAFRGSASSEFYHFIPSLKTYLKDENESEDAVDNIQKIESLMQQNLDNESISDRFGQFKVDINGIIKKLNIYFPEYSNTLHQVHSELVHYKNSTEQDEYIELLLSLLNNQANKIVKILPLITFESRMLARDMYYLSIARQIN